MLEDKYNDTIVEVYNLYRIRRVEARRDKRAGLGSESIVERNIITSSEESNKE